MNVADSDELPSAAAALRNRDPILEVLRGVLGASGTLLEIASGLGDHAAHFARGLAGWTVQPSDLDPANRAIISARVRQQAASNLLEPIELDAALERWPIEHADAVFSANMIHISPWRATEGLFLGAARVLATGNPLVTYGPYAFDGQHTAPSNETFDASLRHRDPSWGVRDVRDLEKVAALAGFRLEQRIAMPANNFCLVWRLEAAPDPSKDELSRAEPGSVDTDSLRFVGLRGDPARHLTRAELESALRALPDAPRDIGTLDFMVGRGASGERAVPTSVVLGSQGMPGDRWATDDRYGPEYMLATARTDFARVVANGQPLELHGDNLFLSLDLSSKNLPVGSRLRIGDALLRVTPQAHNGCRKWVQRFGLAAMKLNLSPEFRDSHLRGIYLEVVQEGRATVGDEVRVLERGSKDAVSSLSQ